MNQKIKQLAEQVYGTQATEQEIKFALLIVKKCMAVAKYHTPDTEECEHTWLIHDKIGKHFGVKE